MQDTFEIGKVQNDDSVYGKRESFMLRINAFNTVIEIKIIE